MEPQITDSSEPSKTYITLDASHPYYLHPSDSPGMLLVNTVFDGKGYGGWRRAMYIALSAKNKIGFIDGSQSEPETTSSLYAPWNRCNDMVISWLLNSLSKEIADSVLYSNTARQIWKELADRFGQCNGAQLYHLQKELSDISQGSSDIAGYYTKLKRIWDELDSLNTCDHCSCNCVCGGKAKTLKSLQDGRLIQFLMGLNDTYSGVRSNILMISPLPSITQAYSLLMQDERQRESHVTFHPIESALLATNQRPANQNFGSQNYGNKSKKYNGKKKLWCSHCEMDNHSTQRCYRKNGFPADFKFTKSNKQGQSSIHGNVAVADEDKGQHSTINSNVQPQCSQQGFRPITQAQYSQLYHLIQQVQLGQQDHSSEASISANFAGPFNEEATGSW